MSQTLLFNPPRYLNEPPQPLPQTVCATLEHSGIPTSAVQNVTDIPPSLEWMSEIQLYKGDFSIHVTNLPGSSVYETSVLPNVIASDGVISDHFHIPWNYIPFLASKWWTGSVAYKFIAIKPKEVTGKLLIRHAPDPNYNFGVDVNKRCTAVEWDLGLSSEIEFNCEGVCPIQARPTWLPYIEPKTQIPKPDGGIWAPRRTPVPTYSFGKLQVEIAQKLVPGSLFPDNVRILVFQVFKNAKYFLATDLRGSMRHVLASGTDVIPP